MAAYLYCFAAADDTPHYAFAATPALMPTCRLLPLVMSVILSAAADTITYAITPLPAVAAAIAAYACR